MFGIESTLGNVGAIVTLVTIGVLVCAECAFLIGLFLPGGDVLIITAGVLAAEHTLPLEWVLLVIFMATIVGYEIGYYIGEKTGPQILKQKEGMFFRKEYAERAVYFYARHGGKVIVVARFLGYVRTVVPLLAGIALMQRNKFSFYNTLGALLWTGSLVMLGYWFGSGFAEEIQRYTLPITLIGLMLLCTPTIIYLLRGKWRHAK